MNLLIIITPNDQDLELGVEIDRVMHDLLWSSVEGFPYVYIKEVENEDIDDLTSGIEDDISVAVAQAEWKKVKYLYLIGGGSPKVGLC